jgi:hypothetical protein
MNSLPIAFDSTWLPCPFVSKGWEGLTFPSHDRTTQSKRVGCFPLLRDLAGVPDASGAKDKSEMRFFVPRNHPGPYHCQQAPGMCRTCGAWRSSASRTRPASERRAGLTVARLRRYGATRTAPCLAQANRGNSETIQLHQPLASSLERPELHRPVRLRFLPASCHVGYGDVSNDEP